MQSRHRGQNPFPVKSWIAEIEIESHNASDDEDQSAFEFSSWSRSPLNHLGWKVHFIFIFFFENKVFLEQMFFDCFLDGKEGW